MNRKNTNQVDANRGRERRPARSADWQSAVSQVANLRHGRLPVCATFNVRFIGGPHVFENPVCAHEPVVAPAVPEGRELSFGNAVRGSHGMTSPTSRSMGRSIVSSPPNRNIAEMREMHGHYRSLLQNA